MLTAPRLLLAAVLLHSVLPATGVADDLTPVTDTAAYDPPNCVGGEMFSDVDNLDPRCEFVEQLATDGVMTGCTPGPSGRFCPEDPVTRGQLAIYLVRAMRGTDTWAGELPVVRALSIPITAFVDCEAPGGYLPWVNGVDSLPQFLRTSVYGVTIQFDADAPNEDHGHDICTRVVLPPDFVAATPVTVAVSYEINTPIEPAEELQVQGNVATGPVWDTCSIALGNTAGPQLGTCLLGGEPWVPGGEPWGPGMPFSLLMQVSPTPNDGVQVHAVELRYLSTQ